MRRHLPPLNALKAFDAAARHLSVTAAADELCVTQGAVSKQIRQLESALGVGLFERKPNGITLTEAGAQYLPFVSAALDSLDSATEQLQRGTRQRERLLLSVTPSFTSSWLISRIHAFEQQHPHLQVDLITGDGRPDFSGTEVDLAIRCLRPERAGQYHRLLLSERLLLVASPDLLACTPVQQPVDILQHRLLTQVTRPGMWDEFLHTLGLDGSPARHGAGFEHFFMSIKATEEQLGLGLVPDFLAQESINEGRLINPLGLSMMSGFAYYLFCPGYKVELLKVIQFRDWLAQELISAPL
ncbi:LysR substrate-binding domain-containing protein [Pontibacterium granulatum]|uniref:LysR substrate-binding domain-containing protein n=1 Tax=Pontibacterium granulatum TaxID=2036029 RepID=UPI00249C2BB0|nr:LysR substrate-binding domain-containing protein [Pontibacterium granulatum]MDI3326812.1 LysR substrate-binding domain-containing protein [Pontibacterium granulatum]